MIYKTLHKKLKFGQYELHKQIVTLFENLQRDRNSTLTNTKDKIMGKNFFSERSKSKNEKYLRDQFPKTRTIYLIQIE